MKNIDKLKQDIQGMSGEEIVDIVYACDPLCEMCAYKNSDNDCEQYNCRTGMTKWLEQECESDGNT